MTAINESNIL